VRPTIRRALRRVGPWVSVAAIVVVAMAFLPVQQALWSHVLGVSGEVAIGDLQADAPLLEFGDVGIACAPEPNVWVLVTNRGEFDTTGQTEIELWHGPEDGSVERQVGSELVGSLAAGSSVEISIPASLGSGRYAFKLYQVDGSATGPEEWSTGVTFAVAECPATSDDRVPTTTTVSPTTTTTVSSTTTTTVSSTTTTTVSPTTTTTVSPTTTTTVSPTTTTTVSPTTTTTTVPLP